MISWIKVQNYKALDRFEWRPQPFELMLGDNGSGKSSVFEVLRGIRTLLVQGYSAKSAFRHGNCTAWHSSTRQLFELEVILDGVDHLYRLELEFSDDGEDPLLVAEEVRKSIVPLYESAGGKATLYKDDGGILGTFPAAEDRSGIPGLGHSEETKSLNRFREFVRGWFFFSPNPSLVRDEGDDKIVGPDAGLIELSSWIRAMLKFDNPSALAVQIELRESLDGFIQFRLEPQGSKSDLVLIDFQFGDVPSFSLRMSDLSEGQRQMIGLYILQHSLPESASALFIDEPDNYLALREIQPWLLGLKDFVTDSNVQCFLISHHPELMNQLAASHGSWFSRREDGSVEVRRFQWNGSDPMLPSELVSRGWID